MIKDREMVQEKMECALAGLMTQFVRVFQDDYVNFEEGMQLITIVLTRGLVNALAVVDDDYRQSWTNEINEKLPSSVEQAAKRYKEENE